MKTQQIYHTIYVGLGGNRGDTQQIFDATIGVLKAKISVLDVSKRFITKAMYKTDQPDFLNMAVKAETCLSADELLAFFKQLETEFGRDLEAERFSMRPLDIDLLYYDDMIISNENIHVPHLRIHERFFVLKPLSEITNSDFIDPMRKLTIQQMLETLLAGEDAERDNAQK